MNLELVDTIFGALCKQSVADTFLRYQLICDNSIKTATENECYVYGFYSQSVANIIFS